MNMHPRNAARAPLHPLALAICATLGAPSVAQASPSDTDPALAISDVGGSVTPPTVSLLPGHPLQVQAGMQLLAQSLVTEALRHDLHDRLGETRLDRRGSDAAGVQAPGLPGAVWAHASQRQVHDRSLGEGLALRGSASELWAGTHLYAYQGGSYFLGGLMAQVQDARLEPRLGTHTGAERGRSRTTSAGVYASWFADPDMEQGLYADVWVMAGKVKQQRESSAAASQATKATVHRSTAKVSAVSVEIGHAFTVRDTGDSALFVEPQLQLSYVDYRSSTRVSAPATRTGSATAYNVRGHLSSADVRPASAGGLQIRTGVRVHGRASNGLQNKVQPYVALNHYHNTRANAVDIASETIHGGLPMNVVEAKAGIEMQLSPALTAWGSVAMQRGGDYQTREASLGLKFTW